jgi:mycothiol synthase
MHPVALDSGNLDDFKAFCRRHRAGLDDSYLGEEDLAGLEPGADAPGFLVYDAGRIVAAAALVMEPYLVRSGRTRFRILYSERDAAADYAALLEALRPAAAKLDRWFLFVRDDAAALRGRVEAAGFTVERTSYVLVRGADPVPEAALPAGSEFRRFAFGRDEEAYLSIRNAAFATLRGSEEPLTAAEVAAMESEETSLPGGIFLLEADGKPVGVVRAYRGTDEATGQAMLEIGPLAVHPDHQGRGYGTLLLRRALRFGAEEAGLSTAALSVNAENRGALGLYLREGFRVESGFACLAQRLGAEG